MRLALALCALLGLAACGGGAASAPTATSVPPRVFCSETDAPPMSGQAVVYPRTYKFLMPANCWQLVR
jgi:ABC-type glycerol-3-phosphate transport system substrate-binding protein